MSTLARQAEAEGLLREIMTPVENGHDAIKHALRVRDCVRRIGGTEIDHIAALLHEIPHRAPGSEVIVRETFGSAVVDMILKLPDPFSQPQELLAERMLSFRTAPSTVRFLWLCDMADTVAILKEDPVKRDRALHLQRAIDQTLALSAYCDTYDNLVPMLLETRAALSELHKRVQVILLLH